MRNVLYYISAKKFSMIDIIGMMFFVEFMSKEEYGIAVALILLVPLFAMYMYDKFGMKPTDN